MLQALAEAGRMQALGMQDQARSHGPSVPPLPAVPTLVAARRWVLGFSLLLEQAPASAEAEHVSGLVFVYERFV